MQTPNKILFFLPPIYSLSGLDFPLSCIIWSRMLFLYIIYGIIGKRETFFYYFYCFFIPLFSFHYLLGIQYC